MLTQSQPQQNHLMFDRVARNHIKNGYFPTDEATLAGIADRLDIGGSEVRIFDPCCGEGLALETLADYLTACGSRCRTFGIELDRQRADAATQRLEHLVRADIENCILQAKTVGLLFLNPPYGFAAKDQLDNRKAQRLEEVFFAKTAGVLQTGGILVLIVPTQALTEGFCREIASYFTNIRIFKAGVDTYRQVVIMGIKAANRSQIGKKLVQQQTQTLLASEHAEDIGSEADCCYEVPPAAVKPFKPLCFEVSADVLAEELPALHGQTLWPHFGHWFGAHLVQEKRRPLCALGQWHSALALAAGQVSGIVTAADGRRLLVKGSTHKTKMVTTAEEYDAQDRLVVTTTALDRFVPSIRAVNLTKGSPEYGEVLTIR